MIRRSLLVLLASLCFATTLPAQTRETQTHEALTPGEARAEHALEAAKKQGAPELYALLKAMPKGADLHMHLSGAVYAETFIAEAAKQGLCVAPVDRGIPAVPEGQDALRFVEPQHDKPNDCAPGDVPASDALQRQPLYDDLVDSFSMRAFVPSEGIDGHDQFFATFARYGGLKDVHGEWLDEVATRAAAQNEQYLEIMSTPPFSHAAALGYKLGWPAGAEHSITPAQLAELRTKLLDAGLRDEVATDVKELADAQSARISIEHCKEIVEDAELLDLARRQPCAIKIHWLYQVLRGFPPQQVFAQTLLGFEVASVDPDVVGLNFVMPEDGYLSMRDYHLQMLMLDYLHSVYPRVHITLHAGELAPGMVPPAGLSFHIREAVELGHAQRIGHGVDILHEDHPYQLLHEMAQKHIMVEVNLTSNDVILGIKGSDHPLHAYIAAHVPFALSTDDEGVSRIDLTHEYVKAVLDQNLDYAQLKQSARASLEHSFLPGKSLWAAPDDFTHRTTACAAPITESPTPSSACKALLHSSEKAAEQYELERRFAAFEAAAR
ncbi:MAG TPA: adenosine deaminase [Acidobacteriaceae bacterium]|jgi:adenosine deaminase|nr:adenosine deaminase [Acidobacteriaceae bacterium]